MLFCDQCDPYLKGAMPGTLSKAVHVNFGFNDNLAPSLYSLKGGLHPKTRKNLASFFDY